MKPNPFHRLPAALEAAVQTIKMAARHAVERTVESLGLAALAATSAYQRDGLLGAQFELNRKSAVFALTFNDAFDERVLREVSPRAAAAAAPKSTSWDALTLVEDHDVEVKISAERFGLEIAQSAEWELRELDAYVGSLLGGQFEEHERNPLRPEVVGEAMIRAIEAVSDRDDVRKVLSAEITRSLGGMMGRVYADIVAGMRNSGVQPLSLAVRHRSTRADASHVATDFDTLGRPLHPEGPHSRSGAPTVQSPPPRGGGGFDSGFTTQHGPSRSGFEPTTAHGGRGTTRGSPFGGGGGVPMGQVDPALMTLMRRLAAIDHFGVQPTVGGSLSGMRSSSGYADYDTVPGALPNLIVAHRDELRQASHGALDHMVIDVIGTLFEQILSDPKVPPQMARQIARLQLPVLRTALGDPSFFASRRHPVRRFVNRIASLGTAIDDWSSDAAKAFLVKVRELVQEIVEGDFDRIETYEHKLVQLEAVTAELARQEVEQQDAHAAELLAEKEDELRLRALYAERLAGDLKAMSAPEFVRDFISKVWSQVLLRAAEHDGPVAERVHYLKRVGRELFLSVQPKVGPAHRKQFLAELPKLMQDLTEGMNMIGWPDAERRAFFGRLMPAHAEALKSAPIRQLDINLLARQVEGALEKPLPSREDLKVAAGVLPVLTEEIAPRFSPEEAAQVGLLDESKVDWQAPVATDVERQAEEAELAQAAELPAARGPGGVSLDTLPVVSDLAEPMQGKALAHEVQIGFAYQMELDGEWQKVRLTHVSPGRSFFVFSHGRRHKRTVSLTQRMLVRLCETGRFRAYESAYLLERATARARRQLAQLGGGPSSVSGAASRPGTLH
jgi:hypothetical protein